MLGWPGASSPGQLRRSCSADRADQGLFRLSLKPTGACWVSPRCQPAIRFGPGLRAAGLGHGARQSCGAALLRKARRPARTVGLVQRHAGGQI